MAKHFAACDDQLFELWFVQWLMTSLPVSVIENYLDQLSDATSGRRYCCIPYTPCLVYRYPLRLLLGLMGVIVILYRVPVLNNLHSTSV